MMFGISKLSLLPGDNNVVKDNQNNAADWFQKEPRKSILQLLSIIQTTIPLYMLTIAVNAHIEPLNGFKNIHTLSF